MKTKTILEYRKSLTLKVVWDTLIIRRPFHVSDEVVNKFIQNKKQWIEKQFELNKVFDINVNNDLVLMNQNIYCEYQFNHKNEIIKCNNHWIIKSKNEKSALILLKKELKRLLIKKIEDHLMFLQSIQPFEYSKLLIKNLSSSWGNCNSRKELSFAFRLIHMKESFIESVIAHEVSHLFVMNHSPAFYHVLSQFDPNYRSSIKDQLDL